MEAKARCAHGEWLPWLDREFSWSDQTARKYMHVADMAGKFKSDLNFDLPIGSLYSLAAPSTPESVREEVVARAEAGETLTRAEVERLIAEASTATSPKLRGKSLLKIPAKLPEGSVRPSRAPGAHRALRGPQAS